MPKITMKRIGSRVAQMRSSTSRAMAVAVLFTATSYGQESLLVARTPEVAEARLTVDDSPSALAFGKYIASLRERNPFTESGPISMEIEASLPSLAKHGKMLMVRQMGASERSEYSAIRFDGDATIKQQVIARYLDAAEQAEALPYSTVAVTPANYKFRYLGSVENNGTTVCVFQIAPKKKRAGLIRGQIRIDSATGMVVHQEGRFVKRPSVFIRTIEVRRDTNLRDGLPYSRVTHVAIETRLAGRAELTITERPWQAAEQQLITRRGMR